MAGRFSPDSAWLTPGRIARTPVARTAEYFIAMRPFIQTDPEWLPESEAQALAGKMIACSDGVTRKVLMVGAAQSAALYVYREGAGPCFLNREAIATLREAVRAAAAAAVVAKSAEAPGEAGPPPPRSSAG